MGKKESVTLLHICCCVLIFDFFKYASLCSLIKSVNKRKNEASEQKRL